MPKGFSDQEKELIRKRLIAAGDKQFSAHGLKKTSVEDLAAAAKISKGAFYLFYESKEALFMEVAEVAEQRYRAEMLAALDRPGPSARARLLAVFQTGFARLKTTPMLQFATSGDYDLLLRRVPAEMLQAHLASDQVFVDELITRARAAGLNITARPEQISGLLYPLVLASLHADDLGQSDVDTSLAVLLELVAAYCLGEVTAAES